MELISEYLRYPYGQLRQWSLPVIGHRRTQSPRHWVRVLRIALCHLQRTSWLTVRAKATKALERIKAKKATRDENGKAVIEMTSLNTDQKRFLAAALSELEDHLLRFEALLRQDKMITVFRCVPNPFPPERRRRLLELIAATIGQLKTM